MKNKQIQGFNVVKLRFSASSSTYHDIFVKEHIVRHQSIETPTDCTLFAINIPPYATANSLRRVFSVAGPVKSVIFKKPNQTEEHGGFKTAFIVFKNALCLQKALKLTSLEPLSTPEEPIICGVQKWLQEYNASRVDPQILQEEINNFMNNYDKRIEEQKKQEQSVGEDDEGWTTVTKHGRNPGLARKETVEEKIKDKIEKTRKKKELRNFYTFQIRESKMKHLAGLRQKFDEDKKKITALKQARKFKPF